MPENNFRLLELIDSLTTETMHNTHAIHADILILLRKTLEYRRGWLTKIEQSRKDYENIILNAKARNVTLDKSEIDILNDYLEPLKGSKIYEEIFSLLFSKTFGQ